MSDQFEITEEHLALLRAMHWDWNDCEFGAPGVDCKRPFGSSSGYYRDMAEIVGWEYDEDDYDQEDRLWKLYRGTMSVLTIGFDAGSFEPGLYERTEDGWRLMVGRSSGA